MKKVVSILTIIMLVACSMLGVVSAKSQDGSIGYHEIVSFVKYSTEGKFHTSIKSSSISSGYKYKRRIEGNPKSINCFNN